MLSVGVSDLQGGNKVIDLEVLEGLRGKLYVWDEKRHEYRFLFSGPAAVGVKIAELSGTFSYYIALED